MNSVKNHTRCYFDDVINVNYLNVDNILTDKKS